MLKILFIFIFQFILRINCDTECEWVYKECCCYSEDKSECLEMCPPIKKCGVNVPTNPIEIEDEPVESTTHLGMDNLINRTRYR